MLISVFFSFTTNTIFNICEYIPISYRILILDLSVLKENKKNCILQNQPIVKKLK